MIENREYQDRAVELALPILNDHGMVVLNMECRTGKNITSFKLVEKYGAKKVLMISPKSAFYGIMDDLKVYDPNFKIDIINLESLHKIKNVYDLIVFDEYHNLRYTEKPKIKNKRFEQFSNLPRVCLTGTLFPEGHASAYSLFEKEFKEYKNFYAWFNDYGILEEKRFGRNKFKVYQKTRTKEIFDRINKYIVAVTQEDAGFTQFANEEIIKVSSRKVNALCDAMSSDKIIRYGDGEDEVCVAENISKEFSAICQMQGGTLKLDEKRFLIIDKYKVNYIRENFSGKIAIYYKYKADLKMIIENMDQGWKHCETVEEFRESTGDCFFAGQFRSKREGITLDFCNTLIFYGMPHSNLDYLQSKERMLTKNKTEVSKVYFLITEFEEKIYETVKTVKGKFNSESYRQWKRNNTNWKKLSNQMQ